MDGLRKELGLDDERLRWVMAVIKRVVAATPSLGGGFGPAGHGFAPF